MGLDLNCAKLGIKLVKFDPNDLRPSCEICPSTPHKERGDKNIATMASFPEPPNGSQRAARHQIGGFSGS